MCPTPRAQVIPGNISFYMDASNAKTLVSPIAVQMQLFKGPIKIPCIGALLHCPATHTGRVASTAHGRIDVNPCLATDKIGSCNYDDLCVLLEEIKVRAVLAVLSSVCGV